MTGAKIGARKLTYSLFAGIWWPKLLVSVSKFIFACIIYKKTKHLASFPTGLLHTLPITISRFISWSGNSVTDFPLSQNYNAIFVYVNYWKKCTKLIPCFMREDLLIAKQVALLIF